MTAPKEIEAACEAMEGLLTASHCYCGPIGSGPLCWHCRARAALSGLRKLQDAPLPEIRRAFDACAAAGAPANNPTLGPLVVIPRDKWDALAAALAERKENHAQS